MASAPTCYVNFGGSGQPLTAAEKANLASKKSKTKAKMTPLIDDLIAQDPLGLGATAVKALEDMSANLVPPDIFADTIKGLHAQLMTNGVAQKVVAQTAQVQQLQAAKVLSADADAKAKANFASKKSKTKKAAEAALDQLNATGLIDEATILQGMLDDMVAGNLHPDQLQEGIKAAMAGKLAGPVPVSIVTPPVSPAAVAQFTDANIVWEMAQDIFEPYKYKTLGSKEFEKILADNFTPKEIQTLGQSLLPLNTAFGSKGFSTAIAHELAHLDPAFVADTVSGQLVHLNNLFIQGTLDSMPLFVKLSPDLNWPAKIKALGFDVAPTDPVLLSAFSQKGFSEVYAALEDIAKNKGSLDIRIQFVMQDKPWLAAYSPSIVGEQAVLAINVPKLNKISSIFPPGTSTIENVGDVINHEYAHHLHQQVSEALGYNAAKDYFPYDAIFDKTIAGKVSDQARKGPNEFVAEVYTGLTKGKTYSKDVNELYDEFLGPIFQGTPLATAINLPPVLPNFKTLSKKWQDAFAADQGQHTLQAKNYPWAKDKYMQANNVGYSPYVQDYGANFPNSTPAMDEILVNTKAYQLKFPVIDVDLALAEIVPTQVGGLVAKVQEYVKLGLPDDKFPRAYYWQGQYHLTNGHHRVMAAYIRGEQTLPMQVINLDALPHSLKPGSNLQQIVDDLDVPISAVPSTKVSATAQAKFGGSSPAAMAPSLPQHSFNVPTPATNGTASVVQQLQQANPTFATANQTVLDAQAQKALKFEFGNKIKLSIASGNPDEVKALAALNNAVIAGKTVLTPNNIDSLIADAIKQANAPAAAKQVVIDNVTKIMAETAQDIADGGYPSSLTFVLNQANAAIAKGDYTLAETFAKDVAKAKKDLDDALVAKLQKLSNDFQPLSAGTAQSVDDLIGYASTGTIPYSEIASIADDYEKELAQLVAANAKKAAASIPPKPQGWQLGDPFVGKLDGKSAGSLASAKSLGKKKVLEQAKFYSNNPGISLAYQQLANDIASGKVKLGVASEVDDLIFLTKIQTSAAKKVQPVVGTGIIPPSAVPPASVTAATPVVTPPTGTIPVVTATDITAGQLANQYDLIYKPLFTALGTAPTKQGSAIMADIALGKVTPKDAKNTFDLLLKSHNATLTGTQLKFANAIAAIDPKELELILQAQTLASAGSKSHEYIIDLWGNGHYPSLADLEDVIKSNLNMTKYTDLVDVPTNSSLGLKTTNAILNKAENFPALTPVTTTVATKLTAEAVVNQYDYLYAQKFVGDTSTKKAGNAIMANLKSGKTTPEYAQGQLEQLLTQAGKKLTDNELKLAKAVTQIDPEELQLVNKAYAIIIHSQSVYGSKAPQAYTDILSKWKKGQLTGPELQAELWANLPLTQFKALGDVQNFSYVPQGLMDAIIQKAEKFPTISALPAPTAVVTNVAAAATKVPSGLVQTPEDIVKHLEPHQKVAFDKALKTFDSSGQLTFIPFKGKNVIVLQTNIDQAKIADVAAGKKVGRPKVIKSGDTYYVIDNAETYLGLQQLNISSEFQARVLDVKHYESLGIPGKYQLHIAPPNSPYNAAGHTANQAAKSQDVLEKSGRHLGTSSSYGDTKANQVLATAKKDPRFQAALAKAGLTESRAQVYIQNAITQWNGNSSMGELMTSFHLSAAKEFGLQSAKLTPNFEATVHQAMNHLATHDELNQVILRAMYDNTQAEFKRQGVTHVSLYRGYGYKKNAPNLPSEYRKYQVGAEFEDELQALPITSWASNSGSAAYFATKDWGYMTKAQIPVEQILCMGTTGFGTGTSESEFVALYGPGTVHYKVKHRPAGV